jgi:hypothetical protein
VKWRIWHSSHEMLDVHGVENGAERNPRRVVFGRRGLTAGNEGVPQTPGLTEVASVDSHLQAQGAHASKVSARGACAQSVEAYNGYAGE